MKTQQNTIPCEFTYNGVSLPIQYDPAIQKLKDILVVKCDKDLVVHILVTFVILCLHIALVVAADRRGTGRW